jgi:hypothetical protein
MTARGTPSIRRNSTTENLSVSCGSSAVCKCVQGAVRRVAIIEPVRPIDQWMRPRDLWLLGVGLVCLILNLPDFHLPTSDFAGFYESAKAWRTGGAMYAIYTSGPRNLNPPWFAAALSPLTFLSLPMAFAVWTVGNLVLVVFACIRILRARLSIRWPWLVTALFLLTPAWFAWRHGQVTWLLFACVTRAWLAPTSVRAALWLTPAVLLKPPLAIMALALPWPVPAFVGGAGATCAALGVAVLDPDLWAQWLRLGAQVTDMAWPTNASLWGAGLRLSSGQDTLAGLSVPLIAAVLLTGGLLAVVTIHTSGDRRWGLAVLLSSFLSPLGWVHYLVIAAGPIFSAGRPAWLLAACVPLLIPRMVLLTWWSEGHAWTGFLCFVSAACLWMSIRPPASAPASVPARPRSDHANS